MRYGMCRLAGWEQQITIEMAGLTNYTEMAENPFFLPCAIENEIKCWKYIVANDGLAHIAHELSQFVNWT